MAVISLPLFSAFNGQVSVSLTVDDVALDVTAISIINAAPVATVLVYRNRQGQPQTITIAANTTLNVPINSNSFKVVSNASGLSFAQPVTIRAG